MSSSETQSLLKFAQAGDDAAVNQLLERHRNSLRRMVEYRMDPVLGRRVDASDVVQEVLIEAHRRLQNYLEDPVMPFHLWLRHIARDRLIDAHRRHRVAQRRSMDREQPLISGPDDKSALDLAARLSDQGLTPAAQALRGEMQARFAAALAELNEQDREVVLMRHVEVLQNQEVAELLGITPPAAAMRYLRAMRRLRAALGEDTADSEE